MTDNYFRIVKIEIMNNKADLNRKCHEVLGELSQSRQLPFIDNEVKNILELDGAISNNGLFSAITPKGDSLFRSNYYLELAKDAENKKREHIYQIITLLFSGIAAICAILSLINSCH